MPCELPATNIGALRPREPTLLHHTRTREKSAISNEPILAEATTLEDGFTRVSREEALQWVSVCRFSPLNTGALFRPEF